MKEENGNAVIPEASVSKVTANAPISRATIDDKTEAIDILVGF